MQRRRLSPQKLLERVEKEEAQAKRGKLKIFFGAAPGVGKTYMMIQDARRKRSDGLDVVVGIVETHGRQEIQALLEELEVLPRKQISYRGRTISEFDIDAALKRAPWLILVDEMAHTNPDGCRHPKRWQDIKELLDVGINVYTTLNVQHIESLNDIIAQITGIHVQETIPDSIFESADTIELIDLPPDDLLKRLQEGKIYVPEIAGVALQNFFRKPNLYALRELALRVTAEQVDTQVRLQRIDQGIETPWATTERLLVCIGANSSTPKLIRSAKRMATALHAEWIAVHVESPRGHPTEEQKSKVIDYLRLAEHFGAETLVLNGLDFVQTILDLAREKNVTKIVLGKQVRPRWKDFLFGSLVNELIRYSTEFDIYILRARPEGMRLPKALPKRPQSIPWKDYIFSILMVTLASLVNFFISPYIERSNIVMIYLLVVLMVAMRVDLKPAMLASFLSVASFYVLFVHVGTGYDSSNFQYLITLAMMLIVAQIISHLTVQTRRQADEAHLRERRISSLYALSRKLARGKSVDEVLEIAAHYISEAFDSEVVVLLARKEKLLNHISYPSKRVLDEKERGVAEWVYGIREIAGLGTNTLPFSDAVYVPMLASHGAIGVMCVRPIDPDLLLIPEQIHLLETCINQIALTAEIVKLRQKPNKKHP
jgi:two-component system sensor histidine kinase KdpD